MSALTERYVNPLTESTPIEREAYEESLKYFRDLTNVVDTSREEGRE